MKTNILKKALALLTAAVMLVGLVPTGVLPVLRVIAEEPPEGAVIHVKSAEELAAALDMTEPVAEIFIDESFTVTGDCTIKFDPDHINNYHDTVVTVSEDATLTVGEGGMFGSFWPSFEGDWETPPMPNGRVINNGTVIVENGGQTGADFDTNNGEITVKAGGEAVCCNTNNGTVTVEAGGAYNTTQGGRAVNHGLIDIKEGATMTSRFGTPIVNEADGVIRLDGEFWCGCLHFDEDVMLFENYGEVSGRGSVILYELDHENMPVSDMDALIVKMMQLLGQETRFENWDDIGIFRQVEASNCEELAAALTGERVVAGEHVEGDRDTFVRITGNIEVTDGQDLHGMVMLLVPEDVKITVDAGGSLSCGIKNEGTLEVLPGGKLSTSMGHQIENNGTLLVREGAELKSKMGGEVFNLENGELVLDGTFYCGCYGLEGNDVFWFDNSGTVTGGGSAILYEAVPDEMPVNDMDALIERFMRLLGQEKRFENWDDIDIYRQMSVFNYEEFAAVLTGERVVAGEPVPGDMDTIVFIMQDMSIPENAIVDTMAKIIVPEGVTLTILPGASVTCAMEIRGTVEVMPGATLGTTMGGDIVNYGLLIIHEGAVLISQMGGKVINCEGAELVLDGTFYVGCIGGENGDVMWFENYGTVTGNGEIILYEAAPDVMPVSDMEALAEMLAEMIASGEGTKPAVHVHTEHIWGEWAVTKEPTDTEDGEETRVCAVCGLTETRTVKKPGAQTIDTETAKEQDGNLYVAPDQTAADILALAGEGARIEREDGTEVQPGETVGSGMILVKPDGTREVIVIKGDNDGDGRITAADARFALRVAVGLETPNEWQLKACLVTGGETVTAADARAILRAAVGLEPLPLI
ncbi:MAG: dockerin type I repeat-containing protein [Clostridia bacterium]|nr:dockerin type I repeat-containing protein [Clostridia bacterium]